MCVSHTLRVWGKELGNERSNLCQGGRKYLTQRLPCIETPRSICDARHRRGEGEINDPAMRVDWQGPHVRELAQSCGKQDQAYVQAQPGGCDADQRRASAKGAVAYQR